MENTGWILMCNHPPATFRKELYVQGKLFMALAQVFFLLSGIASE